MNKEVKEDEQKEPILERRNGKKLPSKYSPLLSIFSSFFLFSFEQNGMDDTKKDTNEAYII